MKKFFLPFFTASFASTFFFSVCLSLTRKYFCNLFDFTVDNFSLLGILFFLLSLPFHSTCDSSRHKSGRNIEQKNCILSFFLFPFFRGRPEDLRDERQSEEQLESTDEESKEASVIVQLTNRVQDGTRCRPGSLDMCIQGKCQVGTSN